MKIKLLGLLGAAVCLWTFTGYAVTDDAPQGHNALRKLGRGFSNLLFGVVEVPNQFTKVNADQGGGAAVTYGVGKGFVRWIGRELVGVYEIVTFPIPCPKGYQPVMKPEWPTEDYEP